MDKEANHKPIYIIGIAVGVALFLLGNEPAGAIGLLTIAVSAFGLFQESRKVGKGDTPEPAPVPAAASIPVVKPPPAREYREALDIGAELHKVDGLGGLDFEYWFADLLGYNGYSDIHVTRGSGDQGGDVVARKGGEGYVFQCKRYSGNVGNEAVREAYYAKTIYDCQHAAVVSNRHYTPKAKEGSAITGVKLMDREDLVAMLKVKNEVLGIESGLWPHNRASTKINRKYFAILPLVPKDETKPEYVTAYALGGETMRYNPYTEPSAFPEERLMVELCTEFENREDAERFAKVMEKKYFALIPLGVSSEGVAYSVDAYTFGDIVRNNFDEQECCFHLENWAE